MQVDDGTHGAAIAGTANDSTAIAHDACREVQVAEHQQSTASDGSHMHDHCGGMKVAPCSFGHEVATAEFTVNATGSEHRMPQDTGDCCNSIQRTGERGGYTTGSSNRAGRGKASRDSAVQSSKRTEVGAATLSHEQVSGCDRSRCTAAGKGYAHSRRLALERALQTTEDIDRFIDDLVSRAVAVLRARCPRQHSDYRKVRDQIKVFMEIVPQKSQLHDVVSQIESKIDNA